MTAPLTDAELLALPKTDLHIHLVGSAAPHTVAALAANHPDAGVPASEEALKRFYAFRDFAHFLDVYTAVTMLVRTPEDVVTLVAGLADDLEAQGVRYAEVTVTPVTHANAGVDAPELGAALTRGARRAKAEHDVDLAWVYDISGGDGEAGARATLSAALDHPPANLVGFGLGGPEAGVRRADFKDAFARARAAGLHSVPHAGETVGPDEIWAAIQDLKAERIGHGIAAAQDPELLDHLRDNGITLEICLSSNIATGATPSLEQHPLPKLLDHGVPVALCSDDPPMFGTTLLDEYRKARDVLNLTNEQLEQLARTGIEASFAYGCAP